MSRVGGALSQMFGGGWRRLSSVAANDLRRRMVIQHKDGIWKVVKTSPARQGQRAAYIQVELRGVLKDIKMNERFRSTEKVERVSLSQQRLQYLYVSQDKLVLMDKTSFEQVEVPLAAMDFPAEYLQDGMDVVVEFYQDMPLSVSPTSPHVAVTVASVDSVRSDTVARATTPATLTNGRRVLVPSFVQAGDRIEVRVEDDSYVARL